MQNEKDPRWKSAEKFLRRVSAQEDKEYALREFGIRKDELTTEAGQVPEETSAAKVDRRRRRKYFLRIDNRKTFDEIIRDLQTTRDNPSNPLSANQNSHSPKSPHS